MSSPIATALTLHRIDDQSPAAGRYTVSLTLFNTVIQMITEKKTCTVSAFASKTGGCWIIPTFDDGSLSDYSVAYPRLREKKLTATFYITCSHIGADGYCSAEQLREMSAAGMEIGSHGMTHRWLPGLSPGGIRQELAESKSRLEDLLGRKVSSFAPAGGHYRAWMKAEAAACGYRSFATMIPGRTVSAPGFLTLKRNHLQRHHDTDYLQKLLDHDPALHLKNKLNYYGLYAAKRVLGLSRYDRLKSRVHPWIKIVAMWGNLFIIRKLS